jgi:hypothetical protein
MSTKAKNKKAPVVKLVRRQIPATAIVWVPGEPLPDKLQRLFDEKLETLLVEYDQVANERLKDYKAPPPTEPGQIVQEMFYQLSGVYFHQGIEAVGLFIQELKAKAARRLKNEEGTLELATKGFDSAFQTRNKLDKILAGTLQIAAPEVRPAYQDGAKKTTDTKMQSVDNGEALVSKRSTH